jgi:hypothetical protein
LHFLLLCFFELLCNEEQLLFCLWVWILSSQQALLMHF